MNDIYGPNTKRVQELIAEIEALDVDSDTDSEELSEAWMVSTSKAKDSHRKEMVKRARRDTEKAIRRVIGLLMYPAMDAAEALVLEDLLPPKHFDLLLNRWWYQSALANMATSSDSALIDDAEIQEWLKIKGKLERTYEDVTGLTEKLKKEMAYVELKIANKKMMNVIKEAKE